MKTCRLCLYKGDEKQVLSVWENQIEDLATKIKNCVSINITKDDTLSTSACLSCIHQVTQWEIFRNTCQKSNEILLKGLVIEKEQTEVDQKPLLHDNTICTDSRNNCDKAQEQKEKRKLRANKRIPKKEYFSSEDESDDDDDDKDDADCFETDFLDYAFKNELCQNIYQCEICIAEFDNCFEFLDHQGEHDGQPVFQCDKCPEIFTTRKNLVEHDKNHRTSCPQCGKMILKSSMKLHLVKHTDKYKCMQCNGRFNSKAALSQHVVTVHTDIKDHICETCGKRFSSQTAMRVHMRSHSDERLYPCKLCNYAGRTASAIYVHMSTHANDLCVCEVCSKTFKSNRNLNDHLRRVHSKIKKHHCTYCDKKFVDKYMLRVHIRCHTGVRPYQCTVCEKAFIRSDGLREHMTTHGQRTLYDCRDCGKKFTSKRGVTRHTCTSLL
ncbi:hypothetical protein ILUMI_04075 [Ignelater luminosus]|uniref:Uncharacterized protein n=1 Tax=Ignelater luminosus TaxID=2038154 RepID=A0A8K0GHP9_IGNLU|nr:hypothetical protein ILUMI_04075 [Ignelater luminosus]